MDEPILQVPSKLMLSPYHVSKHYVAQWDEGEGLQYIVLFEAAPHIYHSNYPTEQSRDYPEKLDNSIGDIFQCTIFLILERLKGEKSFFKPYIDTLPPVCETFFTIDPATPIGADFPETTLTDELQLPDDVVLSWNAYDKRVLDSAKQRFIEYLDHQF